MPLRLDDSELSATKKGQKPKSQKGRESPVSRDQRLYYDAYGMTGEAVREAASETRKVASDILESRWPREKDCTRLSKLKKDFHDAVDVDRAMRDVGVKHGWHPPSPVIMDDPESVYLRNGVKKAEQRCEQAFTI